VAYPTLNDGKYDSEFPYKNASKELNEISQTVRKLSSIAYYKSYVFDKNSNIMKSDLKNFNYRDKAVKEVYFNNSVIGSATVISYEGRRITLLTCAHIVDFADTIYTYFSTESGMRTPFLQSIAIKQKQNNFVADLPEKGELEILAMDTELDIALLGRTFTGDSHFPIAVFNYPFGKAAKLEWGSFVYLMGYPKGYLMVTRGIVSQPDRDHQGSFLVDALFNRGFSGGIVLAIKDGVPNFELVGLASSVSADFEYKIVPPDDIGRSGFDPRIPYQGDAFVELNRHINYGITFIVSTEIVINFIKENLDYLRMRGYDLSALMSGY
jgi:S1-C subfamily serine protease